MTTHTYDHDMTDKPLWLVYVVCIRTILMLCPIDLFLFSLVYCDAIYSAVFWYLICVCCLIIKYFMFYFAGHGK